MNEFQKEACTSDLLFKRYHAIATIFDQLPARFRLLDMMKLAGLKDGPQQRRAVSAVLYRDFRCVNVGSGTKRFWKKP
jgi:hypothetical protein